MNILAGDIGGTHTRLVIARHSEQAPEILIEARYASAAYSGLLPIVDTFLQQQTHKVDAACFAIAGPVNDGQARVTNLPWLIRADELSSKFAIPVSLMNDFSAVAQGIEWLEVKDVIVLQQANNPPVNEHPSAAIIGAGTGLGVAQRVWVNDCYHVFASEAGHVGFAPGNKQQDKLLSHLHDSHVHVSLEMLLSGRGLNRLYHFFRDVEGLSESPDVQAAMENGDPAAVITDYAQTRRDPLCQATLDCFVDIYGAAAGDVALHYYPVDELYIAGGIAPKIQTQLQTGRFMQAFGNKALMSEVMQKITVKLITQDKVGLYGALRQENWGQSEPPLV